MQIEKALINDRLSILKVSLNKISRLNNVKTRTAMNAKISVLVIYVETIIYLLLYNLHDCAFKNKIENV